LEDTQSNPTICRHQNCRRNATVECFECERPFCDYHLSRVRLPFLNNKGFQVCASCLQVYARDPDLWSILSLDTPPRPVPEPRASQWTSERQ
jgi:hypothetical protein